MASHLRAFSSSGRFLRAIVRPGDAVALATGRLDLVEPTLHLSGNRRPLTKAPSVLANLRVRDLDAVL